MTNRQRVLAKVFAENISWRTCLPYYASVPEGSGNLLLYSNENEMMPLHNIKEYNGYNSLTYHVKPQEGLLVIFKSSIRHMVEVGRNDDPRISLSFNFH